MLGPRWMKNISNIRFRKKTPLNWCKGFLLYTFIWHSYLEGATPQVYPTEKMCYFHLDSFCDPQIHEQTDPTRVEVHPSVLTFLPNQKPHNQSAEKFTNQKRPLHQRFFPSNLSTRTGNGCPLCISTCLNLNIADDLVWAAISRLKGSYLGGRSFVRLGCFLVLTILKYITKYQRWQTDRSCLIFWKVHWLQSNFEGVL